MEQMQQKSRLRRIWRLFRLLCTAAAVASVLSLILRLWISDRIFPLNFNAYIPLIALGPAGALAWLLASPRLPVRLGGVVALAALLVPAFINEQPKMVKPVLSSNGGGDGLRIVAYNVMAYSLGEAEVLDAIADADADLVCLVEGTWNGKKPPALARKLGTEYHWAVGNRLSIASRYAVHSSEIVLRRKDMEALRAEIDTPDGRLAVYVVDINPPYRRDDGEAFAELTAVLEQETGPAVIAGDFNVPRGSWQLRRATSGWTDCFLQAGAHRYLATWPAELPLWQIDHAFVRGPVRTVHAEIGRELASDHLPVIVEVALDPAVADAGRD